MLNDKLTKKQREVLFAIEKFIEERGYAPSYRELAETVHLASASTVYSHLGQLKKKGFINWEPTHPRTLHVIKTAS